MGWVDEWMNGWRDEVQTQTKRGKCPKDGGDILRKTEGRQVGGPHEACTQLLACSVWALATLLKLQCEGISRHT